jgi:hypothetical protein
MCSTRISMIDPARSWLRSCFATRAAIVLVVFDRLAHALEGADDGNAHLDGPLAAQDGRKHGNAIAAISSKSSCCLAMPRFKPLKGIWERNRTLSRPSTIASRSGRSEVLG